MLYSIMLVDDEAEVRSGIIRQIPWNDLGFEVIADAENGEDALEKMTSIDPDVIITDIQMPFMSGLEFIEKVRKIDPKKEIVIFSGYGQFEYAKKAISLGVREYILKPVDKEELTEILKKLKQNLDDKAEQLRDTQAVYENYKKNHSAEKDAFFCDWMKSSPNDTKTAVLLEKYKIRDKQAQKWLGIFIDVLEEDKLQNPVRLQLEKLLHNVLDETWQYDLFSEDRKIGVCFYLKNSQSLLEFLKLMERMVKEAQKLFQLTITIGVGEEKHSLGQLPASLREAKEALAYGLIAGYGRILYIKDVEPSGTDALSFGSEEANELIHAVKFDTEEKLISTVEQLLGKMDGARISWRQHQGYILELFNSLQQVIWKYGMDEKSFFEYGENGQEALMHMKNRQEICRFFTEFSLKIRKYLEEKREDDAGNIVNTAKEYVEKNYANQNLSVEMVCEHLNMSPSYFSTIFKRKTGQTYVSYVREIRMKRAAELLNRTEDKAYIIAQKVGYADPYYFSNIFKKTYGVSPSRFRKHA